jgi:hypothetical protein
MSDLDLIYGVKPKTVPSVGEKEKEKKPNPQEAHAQIKKDSTPAPAAPNPAKKHDTSLLTTKEKTKYGTYLTDESIQKIQIRAIQTKRDGHQIVQEAVNQYFERLKKIVY